jgi:hypothetical protein
LQRLNVGDELRELRKPRKESTGSFVFVTERGAPFTPASFNWMIKRAGQKAGAAAVAMKLPATDGAE